MDEDGSLTLTGIGIPLPLLALVALLIWGIVVLVRRRRG